MELRPRLPSRPLKWTIEQVKDATAPGFLTRDRDSKFTPAVGDVLAHDGTQSI